MRNGKYTFPAVQQLKEATEQYDSKQKNTFIQLLRAIKEALPHIEKWRINFDSIRKSMDELAKRQQMPRIDWTKILSHPKVSSKFQFSALNHSAKEVELSSLLASKSDKPFFQMGHSEVTQALVDLRDRLGFSQKLSTYLKKYPDFLFQLILDSEKNFIKICNTRLILYLSDQQIAKAIIKHIPAFVHKQSEPFAQVEQLVHTLNDILSNGRSISTLLRNAEAKPILYNSVFFQIYQSDSYNSRQEQTPELYDHSKSDVLKPDL
jgi:hypothetical protein